MILSIQNILPYAFIAIMALPLPILLLSQSIHTLYLKTMRHRYYYKVVKHFDTPHNLSQEQLHSIFPDKKPEQLAQIAHFLEKE
jgi:hypothetical protein